MSTHAPGSFIRARVLLLAPGLALATLGFQLLVPTAASAGLSYVGTLHTVGSYGLHGPRAVTIDDSGNAFVADTGANRIVEFNAQGIGIRVFGQGDGTTRGQDGHLYGPDQLVWSSFNGDVYVADTSQPDIQEFTDTGVFVRKWGTAGQGDGQVSAPIGIAVDCAGNVYVGNAQSPYDVEVFDASGTYLRRFGAGHAGVVTGIAVTSYVNGSCVQPDVIVSDEHDGVLTRYDSSGNYLGTIGTNGNGPLQFSFPEQLAVHVDGSGTHIWVADSGNVRAEEITTHNQGSTWAYTTQLTRGAQQHQFSDPPGVAVDSKGRILVVNAETTEVDEFKNAAPALTFRQVHNTHSHIKSTKGLDFTIEYNQLSQSCRVTISAKVTVPPKAAHVFTVKKSDYVRDSIVDVTLPLSSRQTKWLRHAWSAGHKVSIASKAVGCSNNNVVVKKGLKFSV